MKKKNRQRLPDSKRQLWFHIEYGILLALGVMGYFFYQNYGLFLCAIVLIFLPVYTYAAAKRLKKAMEISLSFSQPVMEEYTEVAAEITIKNPSLFPSANCYLKVRVENCFYPNEEVYYLNLPVAARDTTSMKWNIEGASCGILRVTIEEIFLRDMCNFWTFSCQGGQVAEAYVMPLREELIMDMEKKGEKEGEEEETQIQKGDDPSILFDIRSYIPGDRLQRVHWKLTARQDEMMVKEYGDAIEKQLHILVELYQREPEKEYLERAIKGFYNVALAFLGEQEKFFVCWWNEVAELLETAWIQNQDDLLSALWRIYLCHPYKEVQEGLTRYYYEKEKGAARLYYITAREEMTEADNSIVCEFGNEVVMACF